MKTPFERVEITYPDGRVQEFRPGEGQLMVYKTSVGAKEVQFCTFTGKIEKEDQK